MSDLASSHGRFVDADGADLLAWWNPGQLAELAPRLRTAWSKWAQDWIPGGAPRSGECVCTLAHEQPDRAAAHWDPIGTRGQAAAWIEVRGAPIVPIQEAIFGADHHSPTPARRHEGIAHSVASRAFAALADTLRDCLSLDVDPRQTEPERALFKPWSGLVIVSAPDAGPLFHSLLLNAQCVRMLLRSQANQPTTPKRVPQAPIVASVEQALADHKLPIQVELAGCELDLGTLQSLRLGDIVPLSHALDEPLLVSTPAYGAFCAGFLGRQAGSKAIELLRPSKPANR